MFSIIWVGSCCLKFSLAIINDKNICTILRIQRKNGIPDDPGWKCCCETDPVDLNHFHKTICSILRKIRSVASCDQIYVHASVRKDQKEQILENFHYWNPFLFVSIGCLQSWRNMKSRKNLLIDFEICLSFWVACVILLFIAWASGSIFVSEQLNYTKPDGFMLFLCQLLLNFQGA